MANMRNAAKVEIDAGHTVALNENTLKDMAESLSEIREELRNLWLEGFSQSCTRLNGWWLKIPSLWRTITSILEHLEDDIRYEMEDKLFLFIFLNQDANFTINRNYSALL